MDLRRLPLLFAARTRRAAGALALFALLAAAPGCDDGGGETGPETLSVHIEASPLEGVAPLDVSFALVVAGAAAQHELSCEWDFGDGQRARGCALQHVFLAAGTGPFVVRGGVADKDTGQTATAAPVQVLVLAPPDLQPLALTPHATALAAGDELVLDLDLRNAGGTLAAASQACLLVASVQEGSLERELGRLEVPALDPGETLALRDQRVLVPRGIATGAYRLSVALDCGDAVAEGDEGNNTLVAEAILDLQGLAEGPDLTIRALSLSPATVLDSLGGQAPRVDLSLTVSNLGNVLAGRFGWQVYLSNDEELDPAGDTLLAEGSLAGLEPGRDELLRQEDLALPADLAEGDYPVYALVDPDDRVADELDEFNNQRVLEEPLHVISGSVPGIDLLVTSVRVANVNVPTGAAIDVAFTLCNRGTVAVSSNFFCSVVLSPNQVYDDEDNLKVGNVNLASLGAQSCIDARLTKLLPPQARLGGYNVAVRADPPNAVPEADETNNTLWFSGLVFVGEPVVVDLAVDEVAFAPSAIEAGDLLRVSYRLRNLSAQRSGAFVTEVLLSEDEVLGPEDRVLKQIVSVYLDGGRVDQVSEQVLIPADVDHRVASWHVGVVVDPDDEVINEPDEGNNAALAPDLLQVTGGSGGCFEDGFEPNDELDAAAQIGLGLHEGLGRCGNDDWYGLLLPEGEALVAVLRSDTRRGNLDLEVYGPDRRLIGATSALAAEESVLVAPVLRDSLHYLRVTAPRDEELPYSLELTLLRPGDRADLEGTDLQVSPLELLPGLRLDLAAELLNFGRSPSAATEAEVWLSADPVLDAADRSLGRVPLPGLGPLERYSLRASLDLPAGLAAGSYRALLQLDVDDLVAEDDERDNLLVSEPVEYRLPGDCPDDALEPNQICAAASPLDPGELEGLVVCRGQDDWYELELEAGDHLRLEIRFVHRDGDLDLQLYGPDCGPLLAASEGAQNIETVELVAPSTGRYGARVLYFSEEDGYNEYRLSYQRERCEPDRFEPNDQAEQAAPASLAGEAGLSLCFGDQDFFQFELVGGQQVGFEALGQEGPPATLTLYRAVDPPGAPEFLRTRSGEPLVYAPLQDGTYLLKVHQAAGELVAYDLAVTGLEGSDLRVSQLELDPVALPGGALLQFQAELRNLRLAALPEVPWALYLSADQSFDAQQDRLLARGSGPPLAGRAAAPLSQRVALPADLAPASYWAVLVGDPDGVLEDASRANNQAWAALRVQAPCLPDRFEPNETAQAAPELAPGETLGLTLCPGDRDAFAVQVPEGSERLWVELQHTAARGDLDLFLYGPPAGLELLGQSATAQDLERVELAAPAPGRYVFVVQALAGVGNSYLLRVGVEP